MKRITRRKIDSLNQAFDNLINHLDELNTDDATQFINELNNAWIHVIDVIQDKETSQLQI